MKKLKEIQQELLELRATNLADAQGLPRPAMELPEGYFDQLPESALTLARLSEMPRSMPMEIPEGYFDQLPESALTFARLSEIPRSMPMEVPEGYFDQLPESALTFARLSEIPRSMPMEVPEGYFDQLPSTALTHARLSEMPREMPHDVPEAYFEELPARIAAVLHPKPSVKLRASRSWMPLSVAASVLLMLGLGFLMMGRPETGSVEQELAVLSKAEIEAYIQNHQAEFDTDLSADLPDEQEVDLQQLERDVLDRALTEEDLQDYLL